MQHRRHRAAEPDFREIEGTAVTGDNICTARAEPLPDACEPGSLAVDEAVRTVVEADAEAHLQHPLRVADIADGPRQARDDVPELSARPGDGEGECAARVLDVGDEPALLAAHYHAALAEPGGDERQAVLLARDDGGGTLAQGLHTLREALHLVVGPLHEEVGHSRRSLEVDIGHKVDDRLVALVTYAGDDGQGKLGDVGRQRVGLEAVEVAHCPAAAHDGHRVPLLDLLGYPVERRYHGALHAVALHDGREELDAETVGGAVGGELRHKVAEARRSAARDHGDAQQRPRERQFAIHIDHAVRLKLREYLLPSPHHVAERVRGVDVVDDKREAVALVKVHLHPYQHLDAGAERLPRLPLEALPEHTECVVPDDAVHGGYVAAGVVLLDKPAVVVAGTVLPALANLGPHPVIGGEALADALREGVQQFGERYSVICHCPCDKPRNSPVCRSRRYCPDDCNV